MKSFHIAIAVVATALAINKTAHAQDGTDIATAIPIYFNQIVNDTIDKTRLIQVYRMFPILLLPAVSQAK